MDVSRLGEPDIEIWALRIWIHGREFEESEEYWDGNWLRATALCVEGGGSVQVHGPIVHTSGLVSFLNDCERIHETLRGMANLECMEPNLRVELAMSDSKGGLTAVVRITPDHLCQEHTFRFGADQSYLPGLITGLRQVVGKFPIRGEPG